MLEYLFGSVTACVSHGSKGYILCPLMSKCVHGCILGLRTTQDWAVVVIPLFDCSCIAPFGIHRLYMRPLTYRNLPGELTVIFAAIERSSVHSSLSVSGLLWLIVDCYRSTKRMHIHCRHTCTYTHTHMHACVFCMLTFHCHRFQLVPLLAAKSVSNVIKFEGVGMW